MLTSFHYGKSREKIVIGELLRLNLDIYLPIVDDKGIDCVIRSDEGNYIELQIKARSKKVDNKNNAGTFTGLKISVPSETYFFLFYSAEAGNSGTYWLFPSIELVELARDKNVPNVHEYPNGYEIHLTGNSQKKGGVYPKSQFSDYEVEFETIHSFEMLFNHRASKG